MTQIDFYILPEQTMDQRNQFACRLIEKAFRLGHSIYIHSHSTEYAKLLDETLWNYRASSFLPHQQLTAPTNSASNCPIEIGCGEAPKHQHDVLINLGMEIPDFFSRFQRVSEIVVTDPEVMSATRKNYKFYKDRGYPLNSHDMRK